MVTKEIDDVMVGLKTTEFTKENLKKIGQKSGIYFLFGSNKELLYIGKSIDIKLRLQQHRRRTEPQTKDFISTVSWFSFIDCNAIPCNLTNGQYELKLIKKYKPKMNRETLMHNIFADWK